MEQNKIMTAKEWMKKYNPEDVADNFCCDDHMERYAEYVISERTAHTSHSTKLHEIKNYIDTQFRLYKDPNNEWILAELSKLLDGYIAEEKASTAHTVSDIDKLVDDMNVAALKEMGIDYEQDCRDGKTTVVSDAKQVWVIMPKGVGNVLAWSFQQEPKLGTKIVIIR